MLRDTCEYADCEDNEILKSAKTKTLHGTKGYMTAQVANKRARGGTPEPTSGTGRPRQKLNNDWIPTQAVSALCAIQQKHNGKLDERAVSEILY